MTQAMVAIVQADCTGCDLCITHCPFEALLPLAECPSTHRTRPVVVVVDHCVGCLSCIGSCPTGALHEVPLPDEAPQNPLFTGQPDAPAVDRPPRWARRGLGIA